MSVKIERLPLMGSPYSFKTKKQGRRKSMAALLKGKIKKKQSFLEKDLPLYEGTNRFLLSIKEQLLVGGIDSLTIKQIATAERVFGATKSKTLAHSKELAKIYGKITKQ